MAERKAVTKAIATRYKRVDKAGKAKILDELGATTGWHRDHARRALRGALRPRVATTRAAPTDVRPERDRGAGVPAGRCSACRPGSDWRRYWVSWCRSCAATRSWTPTMTPPRPADRHDRGHDRPPARVRASPASSTAAPTPARVAAEKPDPDPHLGRLARRGPGFVEIDLVGHEGGNAEGEYAYTLTVTDIATGWTVNRSVRNKAAKWVFDALERDREDHALPDPGGRQRQRSGVHQPPPAPLVQSNADHLHPVATGQHQRRGVTWSRRTGRSCAPWSATTATTRPQNCCCSTRFGCCSHS